MKTTDPRDPLDQKIDALLSSRPLKPSDDFAARVLAAAEAEPTATATPAQSSRPVATILRFALPIALPIAAAIAVVFALVPMLKQAQPTTPLPAETPANLASRQAAPTATLNEAHIQEILLLEEGLSALALTNNDDSLTTDGLLSTLEALDYEI